MTRDKITFLCDPKVRRFITAHEKDDIAALALKKSPDPSWDYPLILDQIKSRQKAARKFPHLLEIENYIFPAPGTIEQASSVETARYKAKIMGDGQKFCDLTGGSGIDAFEMGQNFPGFSICERHEFTAACLDYNAKALGLERAEIYHGGAEEFLRDCAAFDWMYIDPQRRDGHAKSKVELRDLSPDILAFLPILKAKTKKLLIKLSPMFDITRTVQELGNVTDVYILEKDRDCKELLFVLDFDKASTGPVKISATCLDHGHELSFFKEQEEGVAPSLSAPMRYLFEPGPAVMKSGGFKMVAQHYNLKKLHPSTHLYTSDEMVHDFPGRVFEMNEILPVDKKALKKSLPGLQANLTVRNFPDDVRSLKKRLNIKDGGDVYLFACTLSDEQKVLIKAHKI